MEPKENAPEGAPKLNAPPPDVVEEGAPNGEGAEPFAPFAGCEPKAGVDALLLAPKLNVAAGLFSVVLVAAGVVDDAPPALDAPKPKENVGLLPDAGAPGVVVAPNAGVDDEPKADVGVDDAPKADVGAGFVDAPNADVDGVDVVPNADVVAGFDDEPNADAPFVVEDAPKADAPLGAEDAPNAGVDDDVPNENVGFDACPSAFASVFCALFAPPPKNDGVEEEEVVLPAPNENADLGASAGFAASPELDAGAPNGENDDAAPKGEAVVPEVLPPNPKADLGASADFAALFDAPPKGDDTAGVDDAALPPPKALLAGVLPPKANADFGAEEPAASLPAAAPNGLDVFEAAGCELLPAPKLNVGVGAAGAVEAEAPFAVGAGVGAALEGLDVTPKLNFGPLDEVAAPVL